MDDALSLLKKLLGLGSETTEEELVGILKLKESEMEKAKTQASAIANQFLFTPSVGDPAKMEFSEQGQAFLKEFAEKQNATILTAIDAKITPLTTELESLKGKLKEFAEGDVPPVDPVPPTDPAPVVELPVETLKKTEADSKKDADAAKAELDTAKNWLGAFDEMKSLELMVILANVKFGEGSALDTVKKMLLAIPGLTEMSEYMSGYDIKQIESANQQNRTTGSTMKVPAGVTLSGVDTSAVVEEFMEKNPGLTYIQATTECENRGLIKS